MIKAVLIDIDDTLLDFTESSTEAFDYAVKKTGYSLPDYTFRVFWDINSVLWQEVERGILTKKRLHEIRWKTIFLAMGIEDLDGPYFESVFYGRLTETAFPIPGADELLAYLSSKYKLYAASNASHNQQEERLRKAGLDQYFTDMFVSEAIGANKPTKEFFDKCFALMPPVKPEEVALIGDSITADISGGNAYGLTTVWFNHNRKPDPEDPKLVPAYKVDSLLEIKNIL